MAAPLSRKYNSAIGNPPISIQAAAMYACVVAEAPCAPPRGDAAVDAAEFGRLFSSVHARVCRVLRGKDDEVRLALVCAFSEGHLLIEDVPGVGKTTLAKAMARSLGLRWHRVQCTPDLLPSDLTGSNVLDLVTHELKFRPGAVFANIVLADEINRASPKTQAALLEAMEERQVTVDHTTHPLSEPFLVIATQNPAEREGTFPLPTSELDRFLLRLHIGYPDKASAVEILKDQPSGSHVEELDIAIPAEQVKAMVQLSRSVHVAHALQGYMVDLAEATRTHPSVLTGLSQRAVLGLQRAARCLAASYWRDYVTPDDIKYLFGPISEHRLVTSRSLFSSQQNAKEVVEEVLASVPVPVPQATRASHA
ncbi:MAG TPA: MoxR family ATPase [Acidimicrobiales bacterium]|nr:MoxR family ATPase [Acidimicrobiales bacterium]